MQKKLWTKKKLLKFSGIYGCMSGKLVSLAYRLPCAHELGNKIFVYLKLSIFRVTLFFGGGSTEKQFKTCRETHRIRTVERYYISFENRLIYFSIFLRSIRVRLVFIFCLDKLICGVVEWLVGKKFSPIFFSVLFSELSDM